MNFYGKFFNACNTSTAADMVLHAKHIYNAGGEDVLALGSDFDGISGKLEIRKPTDIEKLYSALQKANFPQSVIEKMWNKNALRLFSDVL